MITSCATRASSNWLANPIWNLSRLSPAWLISCILHNASRASHEVAGYLGLELNSKQALFYKNIKHKAMSNLITNILKSYSNI